MSYYPAFLDLEGRPCLVVGGGEVAATKIAALLRAGAHVTVVAPEIDESVRRQVNAGRVVVHERRYGEGDLRGMRLAIAATDDAATNRRVAADAERDGILLNVVDAPDLSTFIAPAVLERGALQIAVSTSGTAPAFASGLRDRLEEEIGPEYAVALSIVEKVRERLRAESRPALERRRILRGLAAADLAGLAKARDRGAIDRLLADFAGDGITLEGLGVGLS